MERQAWGMRMEGSLDGEILEIQAQTQEESKKYPPGGRGRKIPDDQWISP